jgi:proteic killer suppression protein
LPDCVVRVEAPGFPLFADEQGVVLDTTPLRTYVHVMIVSFRDKRTAAVFRGKMPKGFPTDLGSVSRRKLIALDAATALEDLRQPLGNQLEALKDDRAGQHSIRVNDQWRLCFVWRDGNAYEVEVTDYH